MSEISKSCFCGPIYTVAWLHKELLVDLRIKMTVRPKRQDRYKCILTQNFWGSMNSSMSDDELKRQPWQGRDWLLYSFKISPKSVLRHRQGICQNAVFIYVSMLGWGGVYKASIKQSKEIRALQLSYSALAAARHRTHKHFYHWH